MDDSIGLYSESEITDVKICKFCGKPFYKDWRKDQRRRAKAPLVYCSRSCSCAASLKMIKASGHICSNCGKAIVQYTIRSLCHDCSPYFNHLKDLDVAFDLWKNGEDIAGSSAVSSVGVAIFELKNRFKERIKRFLLEEQNHKCSICGFPDIHNDRPLVFVLDHIDGNWKNHLKANLRLVCPNCNSQLDTTGCKSHNRGKGRPATRKHMTSYKVPEKI